jgi:hypothetical protein
MLARGRAVLLARFEQCVCAGGWRVRRCQGAAWRVVLMVAHGVGCWWRQAAEGDGVEEGGGVVLVRWWLRWAHGEVAGKRRQLMGWAMRRWARWGRTRSVAAGVASAIGTTLAFP